MQNDKIPSKLEIEKILGVAKLVDKYDCREAFTHTAHSWITQHIGLANEGELHLLLASAYYFQQAQCLQQISSRFVSTSKWAIDTSICEAEMEGCPEDLTKAMC